MAPAEKLLRKRQEVWNELKNMEKTTPETFDKRVTEFRKRVADLSIKVSRADNEVKRMKYSKERIEVERLYRKLIQEAEKDIIRKKRALYSKYKNITKKLRRLGVA
jgi:phosphate uptake regulator